MQAKYLRNESKLYHTVPDGNQNQSARSLMTRATLNTEQADTVEKKYGSQNTLADKNESANCLTYAHIGVYDRLQPSSYFRPNLVPNQARKRANA